jgi:NAD(P)-dependent dehydrogenase (short-subunit alcohol dehydrogenase family)
LKIVVTGAVGRIGRQMVLELEDRHELVLLDRRQPGKTGSIRADITAKPPRRRYGPASPVFAWEHHLEGADAVLHLAGNPSPHASLPDALHGNVEGTWNVLEAAARNSVPRIVYASSCWAVRRELDDNATAGSGPVADPRNPSPNTPYGLSKAAAELAGRMAVEAGDIDCFLAVRIGAVKWKPPRDDLAPAKEGSAIGVADLRTILRLCLERPLTGFHVVYGISPSPDRIVDLETTRRVLNWSPLEIHEDPATELRVTHTY